MLYWKKENLRFFITARRKNGTNRPMAVIQLTNGNVPVSIAHVYVQNSADSPRHWRFVTWLCVNSNIFSNVMIWNQRVANLGVGTAMKKNYLIDGTSFFSPPLSSTNLRERSRRNLNHDIKNYELKQKRKKRDTGHSNIWWVLNVKTISKVDWYLKSSFYLIAFILFILTENVKCQKKCRSCVFVCVCAFEWVCETKCVWFIKQNWGH